MRVPGVSLLISSTVVLRPTFEDWERGQKTGSKSVQCVRHWRVVKGHKWPVKRPSAFQWGQSASEATKRV